MQTAIHEIGREIHQSRPLDGIRADETDIVLPQQLNAFRRAIALVSNFQSVAKWPILHHFRVCTRQDFLVAAAGQRSRGFVVPR